MDKKKLIDLIEKIRSKGREWKTVKELVLKESGDKAEFIKDVTSMANNLKQTGGRERGRRVMG